MLVLSRREGETIKIGDGIELTVVSIRGDHVRLGIAAPPEVPIVREELARDWKPHKKEGRLHG